MTELELINLIKQAQVTAASGDREAAIRMFQEALEQAPDNETVLMELASLVHDPQEKQGYLKRVLDINPYNEDARAMLKELEGPTQPEEDTPSQEEEPILYCYYHPDRPTTLRCNKCGKPICTECAIRTPVGYRCPDCVREQQDKFYTATSSDILKGATVAFLGGMGIGLVIYLVARFLGPFGFFGFLIAFFLGPALGGAVAEMVRRVMGKRHARRFPIVGVIAMIVGIFIVALGSGVLFWAIITTGIVLVLAATTFYARLKF